MPRFSSPTWKARQSALTTASARFGLCLALLLNSACDTAQPPEQSIQVAAKGLHSAALSTEGSHAVVGSIYHGGSYWRVEKNERVFSWNHKAGEQTTITVAAFDPSGKWALTANPFNLVLWNTESGAGERFWTAPGEVLAAAIGPNANMAILGLSDHTAVIFNIRRGGILRTFTHQNRVRSVALSRDGRLALTGSEDYTATLWDVSSGNKLTSIRHDDDVQLVQLSPDGSLALSVSKYDKALLWETQSGRALGELPLRGARLKRGLTFISARFSADNSMLLTGRPDQRVQLWEVATLQLLSEWKLPKERAWKPTGAAVLDVAFSAEMNRAYAVSSNGYIHTLALPSATSPDNSTP